MPRITQYPNSFAINGHDGENAFPILEAALKILYNWVSGKESNEFKHINANELPQSYPDLNAFGTGSSWIVPRTRTGKASEFSTFLGVWDNFFAWCMTYTHDYNLGGCVITEVSLVANTATPQTVICNWEVYLKNSFRRGPISTPRFVRELWDLRPGSSYVPCPVTMDKIRAAAQEEAAKKSTDAKQTTAVNRGERKKSVLEEKRLRAKAYDNAIMEAEKKALSEKQHGATTIEHKGTAAPEKGKDVQPPPVGKVSIASAQGAATETVEEKEKTRQEPNPIEQSSRTLIDAVTKLCAKLDSLNGNGEAL
jgi:hypothetical protein